jgi:hypothetical protein
MKITTRQRAFRAMLSGLIGSDLSVSELRELADGLVDDNVFVRELCLALHDTSRALSKHSFPPKEPFDRRHDWLSEVQFLAKKKRFAKREVTAILTVVFPDLPTDILQGHRTLTEIFRFVSENAPDAILREILHRLQSGPNSGDEYLKGIMKR